MNILVLMAGEGSRLQEFYKEPKPFIKINNNKIIEIVLKNINFDCNYLLVAQKLHSEKYNLSSIVSKILNSFRIINIDKKTEGAAISALKSKEFIDNDEELIIINSDQYLDGNIKESIDYFRFHDADGGILTTKKINEKKWSYVKVNDSGIATKVAEKDPISDNATVGLYYFKKGSEFVKYAQQMINKNIRINNEFYLCPVYNEFILSEKKIRIFEINKLWPLGTYEEIKEFENNFKNLS